MQKLKPRPIKVVNVSLKHKSNMLDRKKYPYYLKLTLKNVSVHATLFSAQTWIMLIDNVHSKFLQSQVYR